MLKILVDKALMHQISFPSVQMVFALTLDQLTCCITITCVKICQILLYTKFVFTQISWFFKEVKKQNEKQKTGRPHIEPGPRQNKFDFVWIAPYPLR